MTLPNIPKNFEWIDPDKIGQIPKMIVEGSMLLGVKEVAGSGSNPVILKMAEDIGAKKIYKADSMAWCAVSHNAVAVRAGKKISGYKDPYDLLRALAFQKNGVSINVDDWEVIDLEDAMFGDTLIFMRPEGGHIGIYIGESATHYYVMGGNQNNMYSFTRVAKHRLVAVRRPKYKIATPSSVKKYFLTDTGTPASTNEA